MGATHAGIIAFALGLATLGTADAAGAGAARNVCAALRTGRGICTSYCRRLDCPHSGKRACEGLRRRFLAKTGTAELPCDEASACAVRDTTVELTSGPDTRASVGYQGLGHDVPFVDGARLSLGMCCAGGNCSVDGARLRFQPFLAPVPMSIGGVPICLVSWFSDTAPTGTYDCASGCMALDAQVDTYVYLGSDIAHPCPVCVGDPVANDDVEGGHCVGGGGPGVVCDAQGTSPWFGTTSIDCPLSDAPRSHQLLHVPLTTASASLTGSFDCTDPTVPPGSCPCAGQSRPDSCDGSCSPEGICEDGPLEGFCSGQPFRECIVGAGTADCEDAVPGAGTCTAELRHCFPAAITASGTCDPAAPTVVSTFCIGATGSAAMNVALGLPGPVLLRLPFRSSGCERDPFAALYGVYDVDDASAARSVASVSPANGGVAIGVVLDTDNAINLQAVQQPDGSLALTGYRIFGGDAYLATSGTATVALTGNVTRIAATLSDAFGGTAFMLVRPAAGTPSALAGPYTLAFQSSPACALDSSGCPSTAFLALTSLASGEGALAGGEDRDGAGSVLGTLSPSTCLVSPLGVLHCTGRYTSAATGAETALVLHGAIDLDTGTGGGSFLLGSPPSMFGTGTWSVTR